jgi:hypothetical protein
MRALAVLAAQNVAKMEWFDLHKEVVAPVADEAPDEAPAEEQTAPAPAAPETEKTGEEGEGEGGEGEGEEEIERTESQQQAEEEEEKEVTIPEMTEIPGKRHSHGLAAVEGVLYSFGGATKIDGKEWPNNSVCF